ncbi:hypothetical protein [Pedobacter sp. NJ-S-72]
MYYKGANMLHTIRQLIQDDEKFRQILRGLNKTFYHQTVTTEQVENYIIKKSGLKLAKVFDQYLRTTKVPVLSYEIKDSKLIYRWTDVVEGFSMPVKVSLSQDIFSFIYPTTKPQTIAIKDISEANFKADPNFYILLKKSK